MQLKYHMITIEDLVPKDHLLRKVEAMLDLSFVYEETAHLYNRKYGRPAINPVILVKYLLLGYLYGIPSERQIEERCKDSNAFRWYLGIDLDERVPDHSTISQLRRQKPSFRKVFRRLFERVAQQCIDIGLASGRLVATDSTHVKASVSLGFHVFDVSARGTRHLLGAVEYIRGTGRRILDAKDREAEEKTDKSAETETEAPP